jgi:hypothetical protein
VCDDVGASEAIRMTPLEFALVLAAAAAAWLVWQSLRAREAANAAIRRICAQHGLLFLDDTVALESMWPVRDDSGRMTLRRVYRFDYSDSGHDRRTGSVTVVGASVHEVRIDPAVPSGAPLH